MDFYQKEPEASSVPSLWCEIIPPPYASKTAPQKNLASIRADVDETTLQAPKTSASLSVYTTGESAKREERSPFKTSPAVYKNKGRGRKRRERAGEMGLGVFKRQKTTNSQTQRSVSTRKGLSAVSSQIPTVSHSSG